MITINSKTLRIIYSLIAGVVISEVVWANAWKVTALLDIQSGSVLNKLLRDLIVILSVMLLTSVVIKPKEIFQFLGLNGNVLKGFGIALICVAPIYAGFMLMGDYNSDTPFSILLKKCVMPGIKEELVFRAFMFGLLFRYAKTGFFWAVMLPALYFGSYHLYQGHDVVSSIAAFGVTFLGAIYFSWVYVEWDYNIWVPAGLHILMNGAWVLFTMEGTDVAAGGLISNILRVVSILLAVSLTMWYKNRNDTKVFKYPVWQF